MSAQNDGGPAFPQVSELETIYDESGKFHALAQMIDEENKRCAGMTLRDYFAAKALCGLLSSGIAAERGQTASDVAEIAYMNADAMLAERAKGAK